MMLLLGTLMYMLPGVAGDIGGDKVAGAAGVGGGKVTSRQGAGNKWWSSDRDNATIALRLLLEDLWASRGT
jgi:hypothetical protein